MFKLRDRLGVEQWGLNFHFGINKFIVVGFSTGEGRRFIPSEEVGAGAVEDPDPDAAIS